MTYTVILAERDQGRGHYPLPLRTTDSTAYRALDRARELAYEHGYMPRETTPWEHGASTAQTHLVCY